MTNQVSSMIFPVVLLISILGYVQCQLQPNAPGQGPVLQPLQPLQPQQQQQQQQPGRYEYVENFKAQWFHAYYICDKKGARLIDMSNGVTPQLLAIIEEVKQKDVLKYRKYQPVLVFWTREEPTGQLECKSFYLNGNQVVYTRDNNCYWRRSIICEY